MVGKKENPQRPINKRIPVVRSMAMDWLPMLPKNSPFAKRVLEFLIEKGCSTTVAEIRARLVAQDENEETIDVRLATLLQSWERPSKARLPFTCRIIKDATDQTPPNTVRLYLPAD